VVRKYWEQVKVDGERFNRGRAVHIEPMKPDFESAWI
jgi:hypothetical protein